MICVYCTKCKTIFQQPKALLHCPRCLDYNKDSSSSIKHIEYIYLKKNVDVLDLFQTKIYYSPYYPGNLVTVQLQLNTLTAEKLVDVKNSFRGL